MMNPLFQMRLSESPEAEQTETEEEQEAQPPTDFIIVHLQMPEGLTMEWQPIIASR